MLHIVCYAALIMIDELFMTLLRDLVVRIVSPVAKAWLMDRFVKGRSNDKDVRLNRSTRRARHASR
jgi:membrane protein implicated in regulation of membrane protease activity